MEKCLKSSDFSKADIERIEKRKAANRAAQYPRVKKKKEVKKPIGREQGYKHSE